MDIETIQTYLQANLDRYLDFLRQMVQINSYTANRDGVEKLGNFTAKAFAGLGFQAEFVQSVNPSYGRHVFLNRQVSPSSPWIAMVSHLDTVFPPEEEIQNQFSWQPIGERIYGPGTVDIKGGTVGIYMVVDAMLHLAPSLIDKVNWLVCLDASEEALSVDFAQLCLSTIPKGALGCLVFEGGTPTPNTFTLVTARKGRAAFSIRVQGKSAHAGNYHHLGANAIVQMAHTIQAVAGLTRYDQQLTFNVGTVSGGTVVNRVPHQSQARVEMRCFSPAVFVAGVASIMALNGSSEIASQDGYRCQVEIIQTDETAPWPSNPGTRHLYGLWQAAGAELGFNICAEERGGLSDGNLLWQHVPVIDGLGPVGDNAHCSERADDGSKEPEYVLASSFVPKTTLNLLGIMKLIESSEAI